MAALHLDSRMAQDIVARTMRIIDSNINVMDARGKIIGSGDPDRIGELHEGALLALSQGRVVDIDGAAVRNLHGVKPGINLPLRLEGEIVGVIGLTGEPVALRKYGELVCMTAEMMLEQARLMHLLAQDARLREELVMSLIHAEEHTPALTEWAKRLGIDLSQPRVVAVIEIDSGQLGIDSAMEELQQLQTNLMKPARNNLVAIISLTEIVVLKPALNSHGRWDEEEHRRRVEQLITNMQEAGHLRFRIALGNYFIGQGSIARSYRTACTTLGVGKQRMPEKRCYFYQDLVLPVLLDGLREGWQADELSRPLLKLKAMDSNGLLLRTLVAWFNHNLQPLATSKALFIHRNTLEYRLSRIAELTDLDLKNLDDKLLLYVALQLDKER
ncbi:CdaR family transcriptional regulator [Klebsiella sp. BIGb0407]|uniref:CdaR family transcriptional regulator n=1 Tax=Klebsiella sp. BIGb0407 TaxID=2940603 RepID=UPI00216723AC|nr:CdaR family transcriptional regulator [Klebsiella sp. BIGb0407]MCS3433389.1 carbohydrate diacid regulator [Klebsiella sp. BIGb0407]